MEPQIMIYGANGYTGRLIARQCREKGLSALLCGRSEGALKKLAQELRMPYAILDMNTKIEKWREQLAKVKIVLNCAGPFIHTYKRIAKLCIDKGIHYLDITGEIPVFEGLAQMGKSASSAGVMLMPGVGFDVVPSDCMAAHLHQLMPLATHLEMAFYSEGGGISQGTMNTVIENLGTGGAIRQEGKIIPVSSAWKTREIDFGPKKRWAATIPWGDVSIAFYTTGIPNILVYLAMSSAAIKSAARMDRWS